MCRFVIAVIPGSASMSELEATAVRHGRRLRSIANPGIESAAGPGNACFLTTPGHCDCDSPLGRDSRSGIGRRRSDPDVSRKLEGKGWSRAKIERALAQKADRREARDVLARDEDGQALALWRALIEEMLASGATSEVGLLVHDYDGPLDAAVTVVDREAMHVGQLGADVLAGMREDVLYVFHR